VARNFKDPHSFRVRLRIVFLACPCHSPALGTCLEAVANFDSRTRPYPPSAMIIWGSKAKQKHVASGSFFCPQCRADSSYSHIRLSRYFTLYFVPLFPMETLGEAIRCARCAVDFGMGVLSLTREQIEEALKPWACPKCGNQNPRSEAKCLACGTPLVVAPPPLPRSPEASPPPSLPRPPTSSADPY